MGQSMQKTNVYPEYLIFNFKNIVTELQTQLSQSWLFTVDVEFVLQIIFTAYTDPFNLERNFNHTLCILKDNGFELKSDNTKLQLDFVIDVIKVTMNNIYDELLLHGYLNNEKFPYLFVRLMPDKSILLTKIPNS